MSNCKKDHSGISKIMEELPIEQGGAGRHKCAACAYEQGLSDGRARTLRIDLNSILENLPISQAGSQRHKSAHLAYIRGYYDGLLSSYQNPQATLYSTEDFPNVSVVKDNTELRIESNSTNNDITESRKLNSEESNIDLLNYKIEDLINHEVFQFNDFDTRFFCNRTFNVLRRAGVITLHDAINYEGDIKRIPGAGRKAEVEFDYLKDYIDSLIQKYGSSTSTSGESAKTKEEEIPNKEGKTNSLLNSLSDEKIIIADYDYMQMIENWDNRKAGLFIKNYSLKEFVTTYCDKPNSAILNAKGVGPQTGESIILFKYQLTKYLESLSTKDYDPVEQRWELISRSLSEELQDDFNSVYGKDLREYYLENGHVPFFQLIELIFFMMAADSKYGSSFVHKYFSNADSFPEYEEEEHTYETDRIRSSRVLEILRNRETRIPNNDYVLYNCVSDFSFLVNSKESKYIADKFTSYDVVSVKDIADILTKEKCEYLQAKEALSVLGQSLSNLFTTYGGIFSDDDFEGVYLVKNQYHDLYNFKDAIAFFQEAVESNHSEELKYNLRDFAIDEFEYWSNPEACSDCIENIISILSKLLRDELKLGGYLYMDELTLEPNAKKTMKEMVYEALESLGKPSTPEEILAKILEKEKCETIDIAKVQARLTADDRIAALKFDHRYDLKSNNPLVGSIRDFINEILLASDVPMSLQDIYDQMPESRKTGIDSFNSNLKQMDNVQKYIGGLYGIKGKAYDSEYILDVHANFTASDRLAKITNFVRQNGRLPAANDGPDWKQLRSWWDRLSYRQERLSEDDWNTYLTLGKEVELLNNGPVADSFFEEKVNQVISFILQNHSLPSKSGNNLQLANWYQKQWKRFLNNSMSDAELKLFVNILKVKSDYVK